MSRKDYTPGPRAHVTAHPDPDGRWSLVFVRDFAHAPETVWEAITDPEQLRAWAPFDADRNLGAPGLATLEMIGGDEPMHSPCMVHRAERPRLLEYTWGEDLLRWEIEPSGAGCRLTLSHTVDDRSWVTKVAAGWHICLDVLDRALAGRPVGRIVGDEAMRYGWSELGAGYARDLDLDG